MVVSVACVRVVKESRLKEVLMNAPAAIKVTLTEKAGRQVIIWRGLRGGGLRAMVERRERERRKRE